MNSRSALGKGLASLIPGATPAIGADAAVRAEALLRSGALTPSPVSENKDRHPGISVVSIDEIQVNPYQPRREFDPRALEELAQSIRISGIIQPLVVRKTNQGYLLIAGERRLRASRLAGLRQVPIVIRKSTDREALELALVENIQRENLNCIDEALAYFQMVEEFQLTQEEIAVRVGKERATVANYLRLLKLPEPIIEDLRNRVLSFGHGKAILGLEDAAQRLAIRTRILTERLSVRQTEALVEQHKSAKTQETITGSESDRDAPRPLTPTEARMRTIVDDLSRLFGVKVDQTGNSAKGKLVFPYSSRAELDRILSQLQNRF